MAAVVLVQGAGRGRVGAEPRRQLLAAEPRLPRPGRREPRVREALDLRLVELTPGDDGRLMERPAPAKLASNTVTALDVYGSLFDAGARTLQVRLPDAADAVSAVVVLRLHGRAMLGATSLSVLADYAERLAAGGGRLYLSGVDSELAEQIEYSGRFDLAGPIRIYDAEPVIALRTPEQSTRPARGSSQVRARLNRARGSQATKGPGLGPPLSRRGSSHRRGRTSAPLRDTPPTTCRSPCSLRTTWSWGRDGGSGGWPYTGRSRRRRTCRPPLRRVSA